MIKNFFCILILVISLQLHSQNKFAEFGVYSDVEKNMKECTFDKDAEAIVLLDEATSYYDVDWHLITKRRKRIKILNDRGIDQATIIIPFYKKDNFEIIYDIDALTYNYIGANSFPETRTVDKKDIFTESVDNRISRIKFTMPAAKAGSIIEYRYTSEMQHFGGLENWLFQDDIPTLTSAYHLTPIPNSEFSYVVSKSEKYEVKIKPDNENGNIYFEMNNIPGLKFEPFMNSANDYVQRIEFQLASYKTRNGTKVAVFDTWPNIVKNMNEEPALGNALKKDLSGIDDLRKIVMPESSKSERLTKIYEYVQNNFTWNGMNSKYAIDGLKKVIERRNGNSGELNLLLVNLLQIFDIDAYPLLVADRSFGRVYPNMPIVDRFNKTAAYALVDGKTYILDATNKFGPPELIPYSLLNTYALIINKSTKEPIFINVGKNAFISDVKIVSKLEAPGILTGKVEIKNTNYALQYYLLELKNNESNFIKTLQSENKECDISNFRSTYTKEGIDTLTLSFDFKQDLNDNSDFILFNYNLFTGQDKNPFTKDIRFTDINFGYPFSITVHHELILPPESKMDIPEDKTVATAKTDLYVERKLERKGMQINASITFLQEANFYPVQQYATLKKFYADMLVMLNEPILIKLKK